VRAPTLLIVGGRDRLVLERNRQAQAQLRGPTILQVIAGASHLFEEPGALDRVAPLAAAWFRHHLSHPSPARPGQTLQDPSEPSSRTLAELQG
jgi:alpha-beta hydrolase superfamily lysophospholipase